VAESQRNFCGIAYDAFDVKVLLPKQILVDFNTYLQSWIFLVKKFQSYEIAWLTEKRAKHT